MTFYRQVSPGQCWTPSQPAHNVGVQAAGGNVSAPSPATNNRSYRESIEILRRYGQDPILEDAGRIFELEKANRWPQLGRVARLAELGLYAAGLPLRHHRVAGVQMLMEALRQNETQDALSEAERSLVALALFRNSGEVDY